jgi:hypothetical protein
MDVGEQRAVGGVDHQTCFREVANFPDFSGTGAISCEVSEFIEVAEILTGRAAGIRQG